MKTAHEQYTESRQDVNGLLDEIRHKVEKHDRDTRNVNWPYVGSMNHVKAELKEISDFLVHD